MHSLDIRLAIGVGIIVLAVLGIVTVLMMARSARRGRKLVKFKQRWQDVQHLCAKSETWPLAVIDADKLVDEALKVSGFRGRTMGERLVAAQRRLSDNDGIWFAHKLRNKIAHEEMNRLYKKDVQAALRGMRQALMDLGVL